MPQTETKTVDFTCVAPDAETVFLAGTFNNWQVNATALAKNETGSWKATLDLPVGRHEYKFVVDGEWCCEPNCHANTGCPRCIPNEFGTMNRFVDVVEDEN